MKISDLQFVKVLRKYIQAFVAVMLLLCTGIFAHAQVDPSSALLLRSSGKAPTKDDLDSSRYQVRERPQHQQDDRKLQSSPIPRATDQRATTVEQKVSQPLVEGRVQPSIGLQINTLAKDSDESSSVSESMQKILIGGTLQNITEYKKMLDENDYRLNIVDLSIEPLYIYNNSNSNLWLREYFTSSPGLKLGADVWITPFFGFHTSYQTSLNASVKSSFVDPGKTPVDHEWFNGGLRFRKFFGVTKQAKGIVFSLDYSEYQLKIESSAQNRVGIKSSGARLGVEALLPTSESHQWNLGVHLIPRVDHKHVQTGLSASAGSSQESTKMGVSLGSRFIFSRKSQVYWKLAHEIENNLFDGQSSIDDARTNAPITGVDVTNSFTIFSIGYTWGN